MLLPFTGLCGHVGVSLGRHWVMLDTVMSKCKMNESKSIFSCPGCVKMKSRSGIAWQTTVHPRDAEAEASDCGILTSEPL